MVDGKLNLSDAFMEAIDERHDLVVVEPVGHPVTSRANTR